MIRAALLALGLFAALGGTAPGAAPSPSPSPPPESVPALVVRGQVLAIAKGYFIFTTGDSLRVASGLVIPAGVTTGSNVRIAVDQLTRTVVAIEREPKIPIDGEIDAAKLPREYVVVSPKSAPLPAPSDASQGASDVAVTITIVVHVPANTPTSDDVYLATDRSAYNPTEIRMDRVDSTTFRTSLALGAGTVLKYQFTRGSYSTIERQRDGSELPARSLVAAAAAKTADTVARWSDLP